MPNNQTYRFHQGEYPGNHGGHHGHRPDHNHRPDHGHDHRPPEGHYPRPPFYYPPGVTIPWWLLPIGGKR